MGGSRNDMAAGGGRRLETPPTGGDGWMAERVLLGGDPSGVLLRRIVQDDK